MREHFATLTSDKITRATMGLTIVFFVLQLGFILFSLRGLPPYLPIFNQLPWGVERLGTTTSIFLPLLIAVICSVTNLILASITYSLMPLVARVMGVTSFLVMLLCFIFTLRTILLIT
ncbi:MAG: hypothetical protein Q8Q49_04310 [bacterium]|nr:hypothetical protein [bacterium]